ncbi:c-type cytochrome [Phocicoccus pinnipedialis]|uniref:Cytochrome c-550 n=1 Tax=Phocicoccus pinnipedialis TaxID=110845 RepID=A0A6V7RFT2_9BACL|nr:cytochrome c [Jeotgalicoccus pinnipedialis]MBP1939278.1 cytochrome c550 [Jeotgalicoccus pinnipedialis]CAD2076055.1 Cytochrome c-550 [Jeotgalicoccus pinnipedialis]
MNRNPIIPFLLIIFLGVGLVFLLSSYGANTSDEGEKDAATEQEGGEDTASSGDFDAEGYAKQNCASCHGQDFSGAMGPALQGTSMAEEDFHDIVRNGKNAMPAHSEDQISDDDMKVLYQYFTE